MKLVLFKLMFSLCLFALFSNEIRAENGVVRQYRKETGIPNSFIVVTEFKNGNSRLTTYAVCPRCNGTNKCGACYGQGGVYIGSITGYVPCIACGQTGACGACDSNGITILGVMWLDSSGNILASSSMSGNMYGRESNHNSTSKRSTCHSCNGTGIDPTPSFENCDHYPGTNNWLGYYNSVGNRCRHCGRSTKHYHEKCSSCNAPRY